MIDEITRLMRLLEFSDSAFPVGTFSFSNGLETAAFEGIVYDAQTLEQYTRTALRQTIYSDAIAALIAFRAAAGGNYKTILEADRQIILCKMNPVYTKSSWFCFSKTTVAMIYNKHLTSIR